MPGKAVVVGAGPNGLAAAITLAQAGVSVQVLEAGAEPGGGLRSLAWPASDIIHDRCASVMALAASSPAFESWPLAAHGLAWCAAPAAIAHPFDDGTAALLEGSVEATAEGLGEDAPAWRRRFAPLVAAWPSLREDVLGPIGLVPKHPWLMARFGPHALQPASMLIRSWFRGARARALFAGSAAHAIRPLTAWGTGAFGLLLSVTAHVNGWPVAAGGSQQLAKALVGYLRTLGGELITGRRVTSWRELPPADLVVWDVAPKPLVRIAGDALPPRASARLAAYRYGPAAWKVAWVLNAPVPWRAPECVRAVTVHLGGTWEEIAAAEAAVWRGEHPPRPFIIFVQPSVADARRAPPGVHTAWAYCHVPNGSTVDMTEAIERQVERFAPGFSRFVRERRATSPREMETQNENYVGGDIAGGAHDLRQLIWRPVPGRPYALPRPGWFLGSAATPPGAGVHGMCGWHAARAALRHGGLGTGR